MGAAAEDARRFPAGIALDPLEPPQARASSTSAAVTSLPLRWTLAAIAKMFNSEAAWRVGSPVVKALVAGWATYEATPPQAPGR